MDCNTLKTIGHVDKRTQETIAIDIPSLLPALKGLKTTGAEKGGTSHQIENGIKDENQGRGWVGGGERGIWIESILAKENRCEEEQKE